MQSEETVSNFQTSELTTMYLEKPFLLSAVTALACLLMLTSGSAIHADEIPVVCTQKALDFLVDMEHGRDQIDGVRIMMRNMRDIIQAFIDDPNFESLTVAEKKEYREYLQVLNDTFTYLTRMKNKTINVIDAMNADMATLCGDT